MKQNEKHRMKYNIKQSTKLESVIIHQVWRHIYWTVYDTAHDKKCETKYKDHCKRVWNQKLYRIYDKEGHRHANKYQTKNEDKDDMEKLLDITLLIHGDA